MASAIPNPFLSTGPKYTGPPMISCTYSDLTTYEQRLATYPASWYKNTRCPDPAVMAQAGLFRISSPDRMHLAGCSECDFGTAQWDKDPFILHVKNSPNCPLILRARKEHQASQAIAQSSTSQVAPQAIVEAISTPSIAELEAQAIIESCTQLATQRRNSSLTQEAAANQMTEFEETLQVAISTPLPPACEGNKAFEEVLRVAIATPLPKAFECRRCLEGFSSNSRLHQHVRGSHGKKTPKAVMPVAEHSAVESVVPQKSRATRLMHSETEQATPATAAERSDTKSKAPHDYSVLALASVESTSEATRARVRPATAISPSKSVTPLPSSKPVTPPPTYRAISPPPPAYQPPKNYLTVADLYKRYSPLKVTYSPQKSTQKATAPRAYLTIQDLYEKFGKRPPVKWTPKSSANIRAFDGETSSKSMGRNAGKAMHSAMKPPATSTAGQIGLSARNSACDSKSSSIDFFLDFKSNAKTRFSIMANPNPQRLVTQQQRQMTPSILASPRAISHSYRRHYIVEPEVCC